IPALAGAIEERIEPAPVWHNFPVPRPSMPSDLGTVHSDVVGAWPGAPPADYTFTSQDQAVHTFTGIGINAIGVTPIVGTDFAKNIVAMSPHVAGSHNPPAET